MTSRSARTNAPTPLHVLTGFLGSGKTTLLQHVLAATDERVAVLVNEVADLPIDGRLLVDYDEDVLALPGGCVCCALRDDLRASLERLRALRPDRIVLETSGLADPAPVLGAWTADPALGAAVTLTGVVAAVDVERGERLLETEPEAARQLELCDRVLLTRTDAAPHRVDAVRALLEERFPGRDVRAPSGGGVDLGWLFAPPFADAGAAARWLTPRPAETGGGHRGAATRSVLRDRPVDVEALQLWLRLAAQLDGERLLRVKGVARCARSGRVFALQSAGRAVSPPQALATAPRDLAGAEVVVIHRGLPPRAERQLLDALDRALDAAEAR